MRTKYNSRNLNLTPSTPANSSQPESSQGLQKSSPARTRYGGYQYIGVKLDPNHLSEIDRIANERFSDRSKMIRIAVAQFLKREAASAPSSN